MRNTKVILIFFLIYTNFTLFAQEKYSYRFSNDSTEVHIIEGGSFDNHCYIDSKTELINVKTFDKNKILVAENQFTFTNFFLNYLTIYDNIVMLWDDNNLVYFQDLITSQKSKKYNGGRDKYSEYILIGNYNPIMIDNYKTIVVVDKNFNEVYVKKLEGNWVLSGDSDTFKGEILIYKLDKTVKKYYIPYIIDVKTNTFKLKK
jgi:hypothetical protein